MQFHIIFVVFFTVIIFSNCHVDDPPNIDKVLLKTVKRYEKELRDLSSDRHFGDIYRCTHPLIEYIFREQRHLQYFEGNVNISFFQALRASKYVLFDGFDKSQVPKMKKWMNGDIDVTYRKQPDGRLFYYDLEKNDKCPFNYVIRSYTHEWR
ncbi:unnamed protein product [Caenorhabditis angaria]|uniref:Uncharacterized protein n=1 Tax=Caenorhabditis angaria TaxID=860376 RepID=A0A9P1J481_9PELO|nr:unnamed protein product [Caenorhabditis angaria]